MELSRGSLFDIPVWKTTFSDVLPYHRQMAIEVEQLIDNADPYSPPRYLAQQTPSDPFELPCEGWKILERHSNDVYSKLAKLHFQRWRSGEFHLRRWAIRLGRLSDVDKDRLSRDAVHNHLPALLSSIYYLRVPASLAGTADGGTMFINPLANLMDLLTSRTTTTEAIEGTLVVFPSFVDHRPIPITWDANSESRIVVSSDVFYVSGRSRPDGPPVVPAEPHKSP